MRIAYVNANYQQNHTGGGHVHIEQFISNAIALGHEVWVYPGNQYRGAHILPTSRLAHIRAMRQMDTLYVRMERSFPVEGHWALPPQRWLYGLPLVVWEFNTLPDELQNSNIKSSISPGNFSRFSRGCDLAVCVSPALTKKVSETLHAKRTLCVSNGSDPDKFHPDLPIVERLAPFKGKYNVAWIGSLKEKWHDIGLLADAARKIWESGEAPDLCFHILGASVSGFMRSMPPNVYYWGGEEYDHIPGWLAGMQVGLNIYHPGESSYNSPLKFFDYLASGLAVVSTEHPVAAETFAEIGETGLIIPHNDPGALAEVLLSLYHDPERTRRVGLAGRQLVIDHYNWRRAVQDTFNEMEMILREKRGL